MSGLGVSTDQITVLLIHNGTGLEGQIAYEIRVINNDDGDDTAVFSEVHLFPPPRDDDGALVAAIQMLALMGSDRPALLPYAEELTRLAGYGN